MPLPDPTQLGKHSLEQQVLPFEADDETIDADGEMIDADGVSTGVSVGGEDALTRP